VDGEKQGQRVALAAHAVLLDDIEQHRHPVAGAASYKEREQVKIVEIGQHGGDSPRFRRAAGHGLGQEQLARRVSVGAVQGLLDRGHRVEVLVSDLIC
jgi:hypothetical protein